jgi:hypothetical protein
VNLDMSSSFWTKLRASRRDSGALAFGVAFVLLGSAGLLRSAGVDIDAALLSQLALVVIGVAGLCTLVMPSRRAR